MSSRVVKLLFDESIKDYDLIYDAISLFASHQLFDRVIVNIHQTSTNQIDITSLVKSFTNVSTNYEYLDISTTPLIHINLHCNIKKYDINKFFTNEFGYHSLMFTNVYDTKRYDYDNRFNLLVDLLSDRININSLTILKTSVIGLRDYTLDILLSRLDKQIKTKLIEVKPYHSPTVLDTIISQHLKDRDRNSILILLTDDNSRLLQMNNNNHSYYIHCIDGIISTSIIIEILKLIVDKT